MLTGDQKVAVEKVVADALDRAETIWAQYGEQLALDERHSMEKAYADSVEQIASRIPGHSTVSEVNPQINQFIAIVADMRDSTEHLMCRIAGTRNNVTELKRIYFETSALLPALETTIEFENGSVTEYLGDGVLGLFKVDMSDTSRAIYHAYDAAQNCVVDTRGIINDAISIRYGLPEIAVGVGLAYSKAVVVAIGLPGQLHAKAMGACIYRATKLAAGVNKIYVDEALRESWPKSEGGKLRFIRRETKFSGVQGFLVESQ